MSNLRHRIGIGLAWNCFGAIIGRGGNILLTLILARLLVPEAFGTIAMIRIGFAVGNALVDGGLQDAVIRSRTLTDRDISTVFWINLALGLISYIGLWIIAPTLAAFYGRPDLSEILRVAGLVVLANAPMIVQSALYNRRMDFKPIVRANGLGSLASGPVAIGMAAGGFGVWALVVQMLVAASVTTAVLWASSQWRPEAEFSKHSAARMLQFGYKLLLERLLTIAFNNSFFLVIGRLFSPELTGFYYFASRIKDLSAIELTRVVQRTTFPALASLDESDGELRRNYRRIIQTVMFVVAPAMLFICAFSKSLVIVIAGKQWAGAAVYLSLLSLVGLLYPLHSMNVNLLTVKARSDLVLTIGVTKKAIGVMLLMLAIPLGVAAIAASQVIGSLVALIPNTYYSHKLIGYGLGDQLGDVALPVSGAGLSIATAWMLTERIWILSPLFSVLIGLAITGVVYLAFAMIFRLDGLAVLMRPVRSALARGKVVQRGN